MENVFDANAPASGPASQIGASATSADSVATAQAKYAKEINAYISEYIRFADLKAGATLTLTVAIGGALGSAVPKIVAAANASTATKVVFGLLFLVAAIATVITIIFAALVLIPRTSPAGLPSLNSFPDIARYKPDEYAAQVASLTERDIAKHLSIHNVTLSNVAMKKFDAITTAIRSLIALLFTGFVIVVFYVLANV